MYTVAHRVTHVWYCMLIAVFITGATVVGEADLRLVRAAAEQNYDATRELVAEGVDVNTARADGATALLWASHWDDLAMAGLLLRVGANVNAADDYGVTPLERAAENASIAMVEKLVRAGANVNSSRTSGLTPLMTAARTGNVAVVEALLDAGADVNAATAKTRSTALMWAVAESHSDIVRVLLDNGANSHASTTKGLTPLLFAVRNKGIDVVEMLLAAGVDVNETGADGTHSLPLAIISGHDQFAMFLLREGADPDGSLGGVSALHAAVGNVGAWLGDWNRRHGRSRGGRLSPRRRLQLVQALLKHGADPNARIASSAMVMSYIGYPKKGAFETFACGTGNLRGATPLWVAAFGANGDTSRALGMKSFGTNQHESSAEIIQLLLKAGADLNLTTDDGTTPLMMAAGLGRATHIPTAPGRAERAPSAEEAVKVLLAAGADVNAANEADFTALHGAAYRGLNEVVQILVDHDADINARDFRGRTPFRLAEGSKQSFAFQIWPETAELLRQLGADTRLGLSGIVQERLRDIPATSIPTTANQ